MTSLEFAGLPGSGKSHWAEYAASESRAAGREASAPRGSLKRSLPLRSVGKLKAAMTAVSRQPIASIEAVRVVWTSQRSPAQGVRRSLQWLDTQARLAKKAPGGGFVIMDEGPLQALWSIGIDGEWAPVLDALDRIGYRRADRAVVLDISPGAALSRLESRSEGHRRLDGIQGREAKLALLEKGAGLLDELVSRWTERHGDDAVVRFDAERPDLIAEHIRDLVARPLKA